MAYQFSQAAINAMAAENPQIAKAEIYLASGDLLEVYRDDIAYNGLQYSGQILIGSDFVPGAVTAKKITLILDNVTHKFDDVVFDGAIMIPYIATVPLKNDSIEWRRLGVYYVVDPSDSDGESITLTAYDGIYNTAKTFDGGIAFPCTYGELAEYCLSKSGLSLANPDFALHDHLIPRYVDLGDSTNQQILSYIAAATGHFVGCNELGAAEFRWVIDTGKEMGTNKIFSPYRANKDDVQITGCRVKASGTEKDYGETVLIGEDGYVIEIKDNPLITENTAEKIATHLASRLNGLRFRPVSLSIIPDLSIDLGDGMTFSGAQIPGGSIYAYITHYSYTINAAASISCKAKSASIMAHQGFSTTARTEAKQKEIVNSALLGYDNQAKNTNALSANVLGFFYTRTESADGSIVSYWHDKQQLNASTVIYKNDGSGFYVSTDGGQTYQVGFDGFGKPTLSIFEAIGIDPKWIDANALVDRLNDDADKLLSADRISANEEYNLGEFIALLLSALVIKDNSVEVAKLEFKNKQYGFSSPVYVDEKNHLVFL